MAWSKLQGLGRLTTDVPLLTVLRPLYHRALTIGVSSAIVWGLTAGGILLLVCMWLDLMLELSPLLRIGSSITVLAFCITVMVTVLVLALRRSNLHMLARRLDRTAATRGQILAGVDLAEAGPTFSGISRGLAEIAVGRAAHLAGGVPRAHVIPAAPLGRALSGVALLSVGIGCLALIMPRLASVQWLRFSDPFGDHPPYSPIIFNVTPGDIEVAYGSGFDVYLTTEGGAVDSAELVLLSQGQAATDALPMFPEPGGRWRVSVSSVIAEGQYFVRSRSARSHRFDISVMNIPRLEAVRFRIVPPAYTRQPVYEGPVPQAGLAGLPGTRVEVRPRSNRPLTGGKLEIVTSSGTDIVDLMPTKPVSREVTGAFEIQEQGKIRLVVTDVDGTTSNESFTAPIAILADERPFVRILKPQPMSFATPSVALPVALSGEDDYGISSLQLFRSLNDSRPLPAEIDLPDLSPRRCDAEAELPLKRYGLKPGDEIRLFARIEDNEPAEVKGSESSVVTIRIISEEDFQRMVRTRQGLEVLQSKYYQARRELEFAQAEIAKLQEELAKQSPDQPLTQEQKDQLAELSRKLKEAADKVQQSAETKLPYDLDEKLNPALKDISDFLASAADQVGAMASQDQGAIKACEAAQALSALQMKSGDRRQQYENEVVKPLDYLAAVYPLMEDQQRFVALYQRQRALAERMAALDGRDGEDNPQLKNRMRDLEEEQRQVAADLDRLLDDIEQHVALLPDNPEVDGLRKTASNFVKAVRDSSAQEAMSRAETGLARFSGTLGYQGALAAADILEQFISRCSGMGDEGRSCLKFQPNLGDQMCNTVDQLLADAGLGTGVGTGQGVGGGYSVSRGTLSNVGLYGQLAGTQDADRYQGSGAYAARPTGATGAGSDEKENAEAEVNDKRQTTADADWAVPVQYRRRVGAYFQTVADETGQSGREQE